MAMHTNTTKQIQISQIGDNRFEDVLILGNQI
jgi:hypothetical protein